MLNPELHKMKAHPQYCGLGGGGDLSEKGDVGCLEGGESQDQSDHPQGPRAEGPEIEYRTQEGIYQPF
jgi:hypothetical protein